MLAIVWSNPEKPQRESYTIRRQRTRGRKVFLVNGTIRWILFSHKRECKRNVQCKVAGGC